MASVCFTVVLFWQTKQSLLINYLLFVQIVQQEEEDKVQEVKVSAQKVWLSLINSKIKNVPKCSASSMWPHLTIDTHNIHLSLSLSLSPSHTHTHTHTYIHTYISAGCHLDFGFAAFGVWSSNIPIIQYSYY